MVGFQIKDISKEQLFVLDSYRDYSDYVLIDMSESNEELLQIDITSAAQVEKYINNYLAKNNAKVAYGGYKEVRAIYKRSESFYDANPETERNIHLGVDFWCEAGAKVIAPLEGKVHSYNNNKGIGDYGPTIILEHQFNGECFYTLYGHLSLASLQNLKEGQKINKGEVIGELGEYPINGDYAPHLHFQVILDVEENRGDYKGVTCLKDLTSDLQNCPDPLKLLKI